MNKQLLSGLAVGGVVGASLALILTPQSGERTRALVERSLPKIEGVGDTLRTGLEQGRRLADDYRPQLIDVVATVLANMEGSDASVQDTARRERAEKLVEQGLALLDGWLEENRVIEHRPADAVQSPA